MIKSYILHIEAHRNRLPRISFKRAPQHGDRVVDGGIPGTLKLCPECQEGFLHQPDPVRAWTRPKRPAKKGLLVILVEELAKSVAQGRSYPPRPARSYHRPRPAMDLNRPTHVELKTDDPTPEVAEHVELKVDEPTEHVELKVEESPETLELGYRLGTVDHERGDVLFTHKAEYVVDKLENDVLYLVRKDVWEARLKAAKKAKKAKHVEIKVDEPTEHVELKDEEEKPGEIVTLKFD